MSTPLISVLIPVLNETKGLDALLDRLRPILNRIGDWELVFIDDGSTDGTLAQIRALHDADARIKAISFSRNFGKEIAIAAGLRYVRGAATVIMDADLQHPPEVIDTFIAHWRDGYQVVYGERQDRASLLHAQVLHDHRAVVKGVVARGQEQRHEQLLGRLGRPQHPLQVRKRSPRSRQRLHRRWCGEGCGHALK